MNKTLTIGKLAQAAGVGVETIRYYQIRGLIKQPLKPESGFRSYPPETVNRLHFIKRAQQLGFSLDEIGNLLDIDKNQCQATRLLAEQKLQEINNQIEGLQKIADSLIELINDCSTDPQSGCPVINALSGGQ